MDPLLLYIEVNGLCVLIMALILAKTYLGSDLRDRQVWFAAVLIANIVACGLDVAWALVDNGFAHLGRFGSYCINALYYLAASVGSFCWFVYSERVQNSRFASTAKGLALSALPLIVSVVLIALSAETGWILSVDANGAYYRGDWYAVQFCIVYGYGAVTAVHALIGAFKKENFAQRSQYIALASFAVFPLVGITLQAFLPGVPLTSVGVAFALLWVYLDMQEQKISLDPLTQLNNRTQLARYVSSRMRHRDALRPLRLFIIDVDRFKHINDTFGHVEGDRALQRVADAMRSGFAGSSYFLARYGGDEFVLVAETGDEHGLDRVSDILNAELERLGEAAKAPYPLKASVGCAMCTDEMRTLQDLIRAADKQLYLAKQAR
ncbi:GGDEF domain-containing protein [Raoultibacter phocaeensis]|uniref:GGDEF domain-containing protein n=1 Tax=Raoultibacter phocaeensis TaxID=2479841 RepID=UPI0015D64E14|nr:GGDEF domain-containing protein [Raoultibacter phocaeensis]